MNTSPNPYTPMLMTYHPARFYGRQKEVASMLQVITAPDPNSQAVFGIRTIGKTTLLKYLKDEHGALLHYSDYMSPDFRPGGRQRLLFVYLNFHGFNPEHNLFSLMLKQLAAEVDYDIADVEVDYDDQLTRYEAFNQLRRVLQQLDDANFRVVFMLDELDSPLALRRQDRTHVIDYDDDRMLRSLADFAVLIIATEAPISELRPDISKSSPLLGILRPEAIGLLTEQAARALICKPLVDTGISLNEAEQSFLIGLAGRQPFLLIAACELYYDLNTEYDHLGEMMDEPTSRHNLERQFLARLTALPHVEDVLNRIWKGLTGTEQAVLYDLVTGNRQDQTVIPARLANKSLVYLDLRQGGYSVFSTLFADYVRQHPILDDEEEETEPVESGDLVEQLSPIERALFKYMLQRPNQVCTFDELLDAVWEGSDKSKRALEAAVHRLRRSLGENEEIKNVRGVGYKFVPGRVLQT